MSESISGSDKVIYRFSGSIVSDNSIQCSIIRISKEYRLNIGIVHTDMLHSVFFLITTGQLMFLNDTIHVVGNISTYYQSILRLSIHGLRIDVIVFFIILNQPAFVLKHLEVFSSFLIDTLIVFVSTYRKIYFGFNNMIQGFFVSFRLFTRFCRVQHIIRAGSNLFHQVLWRTDTFKRFNYSHKSRCVFNGLLRFLFHEMHYQIDCTT